MQRLILRTLILLFPLAVGGCAVGPDFARPDAPTVKRYTAKDLPASTMSAPTEAGHAQRLVDDQDIPLDWWHLFHCHPLDELVQTALQANPDLQAMEAALNTLEDISNVVEAIVFKHA